MQDCATRSSPNALIVHGAAHVKQAIKVGLPFILLSAPGAAAYAGCLWWRKLAALAGDYAAGNILDCGDIAIRALEAMRIGQKKIVLEPTAAGFEAIRNAAEEIGCDILPCSPAAFDMAKLRREQDLIDWLRQRAS